MWIDKTFEVAVENLETGVRVALRISEIRSTSPLEALARQAL